MSGNSVVGALWLRVDTWNKIRQPWERHQHLALFIFVLSVWYAYPSQNRRFCVVNCSKAPGDEIQHHPNSRIWNVHHVQVVISDLSTHMPAYFSWNVYYVGCNQHLDVVWFRRGNSIDSRRLALLANAGCELPHFIPLIWSGMKQSGFKPAVYPTLRLGCACNRDVRTVLGHHEACSHRSWNVYISKVVV